MALRNRESLQWMLTGLLVVAIAAVGVARWEFVANTDMLDAIVDLNGQWVDRPAPYFELVDQEGQVRTLSEFRGQVVFLNFWASFCEPCRREMPSMEQLVRQYDRQGMVMVAISLDESWEDANAFMEAFLPGQRSAMTVLLDQNEETAHRYGTELIPETYIIDREGTIVARFVGDYDWTRTEVKQIIEGLL